MMIERFYRWFYEVMKTLIAITFLVGILVLQAGFTILMFVAICLAMEKLLTEGIF